MKQFYKLLVLTIFILFLGNDALFAQATVEDISTIEGDSGTSNAVVTVTLPSAAPVGGTTVLYAITANTATGGTDYIVPGDRILIPQGSSTGTILIPIIGDTTTEDLEDFSISVSTDLANDSGFNNATTFWTSTGTIGFETGPETTYGGPNGANTVLEVDGGSQGYQDITTIAGVTYDVVFKASRRTSGGPASANVTVRAANGASILNSLTVTKTSAANPTFSLDEETFSFTAASTTTRISFTTTNTNTVGLIFDDLSIVPQTVDDSATITIVDKIPGNVGANLALWLKADAGATAAQWDDQSGNDHDVTAVAGQQPVLETNSLNFNPVMDFDGTDDQMTNPASPFASGVSDETNIFFVAREDARQENSIFGFNDGANNVNRYQSHHIYPDGTVYFDVGDSGTDDRVSGPSGLTVGEPHIAGYFNSINNSNQAISINGGVVASDTSGESQSLSITRIGTSVSGGQQYFNGDIAEFIAYDTDNSATNKQKIQSYLAIKYGITLNNGTVAYKNSAGTDVWTADTNYPADIFGIAKDDDQGLDQQISKSVNTEAILTLSTDTNFIGANSTHVSLTDGQYLVLGNNGLTTGVQTSEIGTNIISGINREWKVQNTGNVGNVNLKFDNFDDNYIVLTSTTGDFSSGATSLGRLNTAGELLGVTLADDTFITLAIGEAPGAVTEGLALWLKADVGSAPAQWDDQSGTSNNAVQATAANQPSITTSAVNFNPGVTFSGESAAATADYYSTSSTLSLSDNASIFTVTTRPVQNNTSTSTSFRSVFASREGWGTSGATNGYWLGYGNSNLEPRANAITNTGIVNPGHLFGPAAANTGAVINSLINTGTALALSGNGGIPSGDATGTTNASATGTPLIYEIGENTLSTGGGFPRAFTGEITEIIAYNQALSAADAQKVQSYLAIKYGITLNNGTVAYKNSAGTDVWTADTNYPADIFGIAKDDDQALDQQISKSVNIGSIVTLSTDTNFTGANGTHTSLANGQYLVIGNNGNSSHPFDAVNTDLNTAIYFERSAREWKAVNTGSVGAVNLQFDGYDNTWVLLTRTADGDFSATTGTTSTPLSATGTVATTFTGTTFFTLARLATNIEFELAAASDAENTGANLPNLLVNGTLHQAASIDVTLNAASSATVGTDFTFASATTSPTTATAIIPAGTYNASTLALNTLNLSINQLDEQYPVIRNYIGDVISEAETLVAPSTGTYRITLSAKSFEAEVPGTPNIHVIVGTTPGASDTFTATTNRIDAATPKKTYTFSLTAGTTYHITTVAGGTSQGLDVAMVLDYTPPIDFSITGDTTVEPDETIDLTLSNGQDGILLAEVSGGTLIDNHVYTITNDDTAAVTIEDVSGNENDGNITFTATLDNAVQGGFTVDVSSADGTATTADNDYTAIVSEKLTFTGTAGETQTFTFTPTADTKLETDEIATLSMGNLAGTTLTIDITDSATATITNDDTATVSIAADADADEATASRTFTLTMSAAASTDVEVSYALTGTAANPADYTDATTVNGTVTILAGATTGTIDLTVVDDALSEGSETVIATLTAATNNASVTANTTPATLNITDNDNSLTVSIAADADADEATASRAFTLTMSAAASTDVEVSYALTGTAANPADYTDATTINGTVTILAGATTGTIDLTVVDDALSEGSETVIATLTAATNNASVTANTTPATLNITDNDNSLTVSIAADADADEATASRAFTLTMSAAASTDVEVSYALTGTAANPADYADATTVAGTVTIAAGSTMGTIDLTVVDDALSEGTETVIATLTAVTNNASVTASTAPATLNITDNDNSLTVSIAADADADEATASRAFTLTMSAAASTDVEVSYALTGTAANPADYKDATTVNGTVTIAAGSTTGTIDLTVVDDALSEGTETVIATLTAATNNASVTASTSPVTLNITDNDTATVTIAADADADEATASRAFTLTMSAAASTDVEVSYALTGTAVNPADYTDATTVNGTVTIAAGSTTGTIDLTVVDDALSEGTETVIATLTAATNNPSVTASTAPATLNITDNDNSLTVSIVADADADEATASRAFTLTMSAAASTDVEVSYALTGTAANPADYTDATTVNGTVTIAAGSTTGTIDLTVVDDALSEGSETVIATLTAATNNASVTATTTPATLNITDNDNSLTVSIAADADADEATASRAFTLTMSAAASTDVEVSYALTGTAANPADYTDATTVNGTVTIAAGATTGTIDLTVVDDAAVELTETIIATLTAATNNASVTANTTPTTLNITDNDACNDPINLAVSDVQITTADLAWTQPAAGGVITYDWIVVASGDGPTGTIVISGSTTAPVITVDNAGTLVKATDYDFYVRSVCSPTASSSYAGPIAFTTLADNDDDGIDDTTDTDDDNDGTPDTEDDFPLDENEDTDTDGDGTGDNADTDDDNDGTPDTEDDFPLDENEDTDTDGDGTGDNADTDDDGDGTPDTEDDFPLDENEDTDTDGDGTGDNADTDDDNDGTPDTEDDFPLDENEDTDTDGDGTGDNADTDDDNDGTPDTEDDFPLDENEDTDTDGDGTGDNADTDDDGDGTPDTEDDFPLDENEDTDTDGDGTGDNADTDDDNDGTPDTEDDFPLDENEDTDTDGDGTGDNADTDDDGDGTPDTDDDFPLDENEDTDTDGDGTGDNADTDDDNDGTPDTEDDFPLDENEDTDTDGDGTGDNADTDDDNDGTPDTEDDFPLDENEDTDTDGDGTGDNADTDDDGDGTPDTEDDFPLDENEDTDTDGDGTGDNADTDDDNDGTPDTEDDFPLDENEDTDTDGDGTGDNADTDDDNDGTPDTEDDFPLDENEDTDTDGDGTGDNADTDDDGDGTPDTEDDFPLDENEDTDTDGDGTGDNADTDDDNDGTPDTEDDFPLDENEDTDTDGDGTGDNADTDDDGDGTPDTDDDFPLDENEDTDTDGDGTGDNADTDDDNDGTPDTEDDFPLDENEDTDTDGDGTGDNADTDDDNDGTPDTEDDFPLDENEDTDTDGDGTGDNADTDDDNDGTPDTEDDFPLDENEDTDTDGDGTGDNGDTDDDGDGTPDTEDDFPLDENEDTDTDGDGTGDNADTDDDNDGTPDTEDDFPLDENEDTDTDGDGTGDNADTDDDNDGTPDTEDDFPIDENEDTDTDGDGTGDNADTDDDGDGTPDTEDDFPLDENEDTDTDGDGTGDNADTDDDNDGTPDTEDDFPLDENEDTDTDGDGTGDNADTDDDGDGQSDADEIACGSSPTDDSDSAADNDGDNIPNCSDPDDDNDGVADVLDNDDDNDGQSDEDEIACGSDPANAQSVALDSDGNGIPDCLDEDDDGDGHSDEHEISCGSDPLDGTDLSPDNDLDGIPNCADDDNDNDGILDVFDDDNDGDGQSNLDELACGSDPLDSSDTALDTDGDGIPDCQDDDDDNDGTPDAEDAFPLDETEDTDTDGDGEGDNSDEDADDDGILDEDDLEPLLPYDPDADDDMDGIPNYIEDFNGDGNPYNDDSDGDGMADFLEPYDPDADYDGDGVANRFEDTDNDGDLFNDDCDEDGIPNFIDTDPCGAISAGAFTPNGDGINDTWTILGIEGYPFNTVKVYNRYGHEVFGARGYQNDWIGGYQDSGDKLPPGSYYYQINLGDGSPPIDGWMFINY
ncbi:Calx-beta domain-containing protein [Maribacter sp. 2308TA10-17]|uniref:Calx-beta domain-containing protein n=1 Tax=Maribacter sp. 2308TA10-17 TaxID=3386276 RepID=UPI0039BD0A8C